MIEPMPLALRGCADKVTGWQKTGVPGKLDFSLADTPADTHFSNHAKILACLGGDSADFG